MNTPALWGHQAYGLEMLSQLPENSGLLLAWDMGTGKSRVIVEFINRHKPRRVLIVAPKSVVPVWPREFLKYSTISPVVVAPHKGGTVRRAQEIAAALNATAHCVVVVINYDIIFKSNISGLLRKYTWDLMVCDESQRIKQPTGKWSKAIFNIGRMARKRVCLSGTPMPQGALDIFGQARFLDPSVFGLSYTAFKARYAITHPLFPSKVIQYINMDEFRNKLGLFSHFIRKEDVLDLPPIVHEIYSVQLEPEVMRVYQSLERDAFLMLKDHQNAHLQVDVQNVLGRIIKLQQVTSGFIYDNDKRCSLLGGAKKNALEDILSELPDKNVVIFARFIHDLDSAHTVCSRLGRKALELSGRAHEISGYWDAEATDTNTAIVQVQSGGLGIDLTQASYAIFISKDWSASTFDQAVSRLHRPGQRKSVTCIHLIAEETVDEEIHRAVEAKIKSFEALVKIMQEGFRERSQLHVSSLSRAEKKQAFA